MEVEIPEAFGGGRFIVEEELGRGAVGVVYKAFDKERGMPVALKTLLRLDSASLYYFKREFRALHDIVHPNLCSFMELIQDEKSWFLTMELLHGVDFLTFVSTSKYAPRKESRNDIPHTSSSQNQVINDGNQSIFDETRLRKSLIGLCNGLSALHAAGKIHRDIKPSNVLVTNDERVVLLDFGLIAEKELSRNTELGSIIGTAAYMAPEQADSEIVGPEADWYSVGVMLFEALTGRLPFEGSPAKIILEKQSKQPSRPRDIRSGLPEDLERLCFALLNRSPQSRPNPLEFLNLLDAYSASSKHSVLPNSTVYTQGELFVGRTYELKLLKESFDNSSKKGTFEAVIIEGVSGVGKSALLESFTSSLLAENDSIVVLNGQCYEHETSPHKAFDGIVEGLIRHFRSISKEELSQLEPRQPELLIRLFPALRRCNYFANIPLTRTNTEDLHELKRRCFVAFGEILSSISQKRPLVMVIDDMQWTDLDSLYLLKQLVSGDNVPQMLLILLSRYIKESGESAWDWNEVVTNHPRRIHLKPLSKSESTELTQFFISRQQSSVEVSAELIAAEAAGHPMYIGELVRYLSAHGGEEWKNLRLDDAIWQRVKSLPESARAILELVCVTGSPSHMVHLQNLTQLRSEEFYKSLSLLRAGRFIKSRKFGTGRVIEPYHDRVRESVVIKLRERGDAEEMHLTIGRFLLSTYTDDELEENIFDVLPHYQDARSLITDEKELALLAKLYLTAGIKARYSSAYAASLSYLQEGISLLAADSFDKDYSLTLALYEEAAESSRLMTSRENIIKYTDLIFQNARSVLDKVNGLCSKVRYLYAEGNYAESLQSGIQMLKQLGLNIPYNPGKGSLLMALMRAKGSLYGKTDEEIIALPRLENRKILAMMRILSALSLTAYGTNKNLYAYFILTQIRLISKHGHSEYSAITFCSWGVILCGKLGDREGGYRFGKLAQKLKDVYPDTTSTCRINTLLNGFIFPWKDSLLHTAQQLEKAHKHGLDSGEYQYSTVAIAFYLNHMLFGGFLEISQLVEKMRLYIQVVKNMKHIFWSYFIAANLYSAINLLRTVKNPLLLDGDEGSEKEMLERSKEEDNELSVWCIYAVKNFLSVYFGHYDEGISSATNARSLKAYHSESGHPSSAYSQFHEAIIYLRATRDNGANNIRKNMQIVNEIEADLAKSAQRAPLNYHCLLSLLRAEKHRRLSKPHLAMDYYRDAIETATNSGQLSIEALGKELAADFHLEQGDLQTGKKLAQEALSVYRRWGALAKVSHLEKKYGHLYQD